jgi:protein-disulfide isomerase
LTAGLDPDHVIARYEAFAVTAPVAVDVGPALNVSMEAGAKPGAPATVEVVEFVDFDCPHCARLQKTLEEVVAKRPQAILYVECFPLTVSYPNAVSLCQAAWAAGQQGRYRAYADLLFAQQDALRAGSPDTTLDALAGQAGLDVARFDRDRVSAAATEVIRSGQREGQALGVNQTPTTFIGGRRLAGTANAAEMEMWVDAQAGP